jgi:hypothetical protein
VRALPKRRAAAIAGVWILAAACVIALAPAASAHGAGGDDAPASNYRSQVTAGPGVDGVTVRTIDAGEKLEVVNTTDDVVIVKGYDGEPYLRIGPDGVEENQNSAATYLNRTADGSAVAPPEIGDGPPVWETVSSESSARWHDHRAHWMGGDPPIVTSNPGERHELADWTVPMQMGDRALSVDGTTEWIPAPSPLPWLLTVLSSAAVVFALVVRRRTMAALVVSAVILAPTLIATTVGSWQSNAEAAIGKTPALALPFFILSLLLAALFIARSKPHDSLVLAGGLGAAAALVAILARLDWLTRSQLPTALSPVVARMATSLIIGIGLGLAVGSTWVLVRPLVARTRSVPVPSAPGARSTATPAGSDEPRAGAEKPERIDLETTPPLDTVESMLPGLAGSRKRIAVGALVAIVVAAVVGQVTSGGESDESARSGIDDLCAAIAAATSDDVIAVRTAFEGPPHDALHTLAGRTEKIDRSTAGTLLRAKQKIEANLAEPAATLEPLLDPLAAAIIDAAAVVGDESPSACSTEGT